MTKTFIPKVYFIDDRPGEEMTATANTVEGVTALKTVLPHLRDVTKAEYHKMERRIARLDKQEAGE